MRILWKRWRTAPAALPALVVSLMLPALLLAGCSGGSITPGQGGSGGLGTPGTGTGNPDATFVFTLRGGGVGDFEAEETRTQSTFLGFTIQGIQNAGPTTNRILRVASVRFTGLPVAGRSYRLDPFTEGDGTTEDEHALFQYTEQYTTQSQFRTWTASKGTIHVDRVTSDHIEGTFGATLEPSSAAAKGTLTVSDGDLLVKYQQ